MKAAKLNNKMVKSQGGNRYYPGCLLLTIIILTGIITGTFVTVLFGLLN